MENFKFLIEHPLYYKTVRDEEHTIYFYKFPFDELDYRGLVGIPQNKDSTFFHKFFPKGIAGIEKTWDEIPHWFQELVIKSCQNADHMFRLQRLLTSTKSEIKSMKSNDRLNRLGRSDKKNG